MRRLVIAAMAFGGVITGLDAPAASDPPVISVMSGASPRTIPLWKAFDARLVELGWIDGENIIIEFRNPEGSADLMAQMADELVALEPAVIVATGPEATLAAVRERAHAIPIVFVAVDYDPVDLGYVASYARPGGNVTGIAVPRGEVNAKRLQLLVEAMPSVKSVAIFGDDLTGDQAQSLEAAAGAVGLATEVVNFADPPYDFTVAVAEAAATADAILTVTSPVLFHQREELFAAALDHRVPVFFGNSRSAAQGALMGFGPSLPNLFADAASYTHRILNGADPAQLPIQRPTAYELSINLKTAAALGIEIPRAVVLRADEVIE